MKELKQPSPVVLSYERVSDIIREHLAPLVGTSGVVDLEINNAALQIITEMMEPRQ